MAWWDKATSFVSDKAQALGQKAVNVATPLAKKVEEGARQTYNFGVDHAGQIADISGKVSDVAGYIQKGATLAGAGIAATGVGLPLAGVVEGIGAAAGGVSKVAGGVSKVAGVVDSAKKKGIIKRIGKGKSITTGFDFDKL
tara:strand:- start:1089 stop:1511 length:423 start_codon:yes stop_codon:yes gene_type:complete